MLNLLISIISQSFSEINRNYSLAALQEKARIIYENKYLVPLSADNSDEKQRFVMIIKKLSQHHELENKKTAMTEIRGNLRLLVSADF